jgi:hypothetical protein
MNYLVFFCRSFLSILALLVSISTVAQNPSAKKDDSPSFEDHILRANSFFKEGKLAEALTEAQLAAKLDPKRYEAPAAAALILQAAKKTDEARSAIAAALALAPAEKKEKLQAIANLLNDSSKSSAETQSRAAADSTNNLTTADRKDLDVLMVIVDEADSAKNDESRKKLLTEFLSKSTSFAQKHPTVQSIWLVRAAASAELDDAENGWSAAQQLLSLHADDSDDPKTRKVMAVLRRKGWLENKRPSKVEFRISDDSTQREQMLKKFVGTFLFRTNVVYDTGKYGGSYVREDKLLCSAPGLFRADSMIQTFYNSGRTDTPFKVSVNYETFRVDLVKAWIVLKGSFNNNVYWRMLLLQPDNNIIVEDGTFSEDANRAWNFNYTQANLYQRDNPSSDRTNDHVSAKNEQPQTARLVGIDEDFSIPPDSSSSITIDLLSAKTVENGGDLQVTIELAKSGTLKSYLINPVHGRIMAVADGERYFSESDDGWQSEFKSEFSNADKKRSDEHWFFLMSRDRQVFSKFVLRIDAPSQRGSGRLSLHNGVANPNGSPP